VVWDTDASVKFYRDLLGMHIAGESENYGNEQEHLNNVFGAHLRITALRGASGPGIELLEYLTPRDGRPFPSDEQASDYASLFRLMESEYARRSVYGDEVLRSCLHALVHKAHSEYPSEAYAQATGDRLGGRPTPDAMRALRAPSG